MKIGYMTLSGVTCQARRNLPDPWLSLTLLLAHSTDEKGKEDCFFSFLLKLDIHKP
jgi:hypothetical protein